MRLPKRHPDTQFKLVGKPIHPVNRPISKKLWRLEYEPLKIQFYHKGTLCGIELPLLFKWDGASIPWQAWTIIRLSPGGICLLFSAFHDWLYRTAGNSKPLKQANIAPVIVTGKTRFTRWECDVLMRDIMVWDGVFSKFQYRTAYRLVHRFGRRFFGKPPPDF